MRMDLVRMEIARTERELVRQPPIREHRCGSPCARRARRARYFFSRLRIFLTMEDYKRNGNAESKYQTTAPKDKRRHTSKGHI